MRELRAYFEDVEARIDPEEEERIAEEWENFCLLNCREEFFSPRRRPSPPGIEWPKVPINEAFRDPELMV